MLEEEKQDKDIIFELTKNLFDMENKKKKKKRTQKMKEWNANQK